MVSYRSEGTFTDERNDNLTVFTRSAAVHHPQTGASVLACDETKGSKGAAEREITKENSSRGHGRLSARERGDRAPENEKRG